MSKIANKDKKTKSHKQKDANVPRDTRQSKRTAESDKTPNKTSFVPDFNLSSKFKKPSNLEASSVSVEALPEKLDNQELDIEYQKLNEKQKAEFIATLNKPLTTEDDASLSEDILNPHRKKSQHRRNRSPSSDEEKQDRFSRRAESEDENDVTVQELSQYSDYLAQLEVCLEEDGEIYSSLMQDTNPKSDIDRMKNYVRRIKTKVQLREFLTSMAQKDNKLEGMRRTAKNMILVFKYINLTADQRRELDNCLNRSPQVAPYFMSNNTFKNYVGYLNTDRFKMNVIFLTKFNGMLS
jgi:hypothetical protein